jgi:hypothetical protein
MEKFIWRGEIEFRGTAAGGAPGEAACGGAHSRVEARPAAASRGM